MPMTTEKLKAQQELPEVKRVKTDFNNINLSKEEFIAKRRKEKEFEARLEIEKEKIEKELEEEGAKDEIKKGGRPAKVVDHSEEYKKENEEI